MDIVKQNYDHPSEGHFWGGKMYQRNNETIESEDSSVFSRKVRLSWAHRKQPTILSRSSSPAPQDYHHYYHRKQCYTKSKKSTKDIVDYSHWLNGLRNSSTDCPPWFNNFVQKLVNSIKNWFNIRRTSLKRSDSDCVSTVSTFQQFQIKSEQFRHTI